ncbi:hypothetical protein CBL_05734 [Carabus blaptoides fortunei]
MLECLLEYFTTMCCRHVTFLVSIFFVVTLAKASPIMVKFGTKDGPIVYPITTTTTASPNIYPSLPAPVHENQYDVPNPNVYRPLLPHQYRTKIYKYKPNPNLILGTPLDQKYTPSLQKYSGNPRIPKSVDFGYTGPQTFGHDDRYQHIDNYGKYEKSQVQPRSYDIVANDQVKSSSKTVPQIGVVYSAGIRYYVPQIVYYDDDAVDNSIYEANDLKYYYHNNNRRY